MSIINTQSIGNKAVAPKKLTLDSLIDNGWTDYGYKSSKPENSVPASIGWNVNVPILEIKGIWVFDGLARVTVNATSAGLWSGKYVQRVSNSNGNSSSSPKETTYKSTSGAGSVTFKGNVNYMVLINDFSEFQEQANLTWIAFESFAGGNAGFSSTRYEVSGRLLIKT